ncbi:HAMP domain-containing histidine kinase [Fulvivirgaceae bacterium PWU4]|uniref:histidine kinase n=1 Tax=Chryseosolibacter histidini TaxID=2782349 RepID=A0AAP2DIK3_9BACT|nr:HAMP domain-containing sensor histidine kinase [Chryseosolibacter histidini]MBT1696244.1 HAMP domain-containing histidine kinase [Chryseosolibacter histidini]
MRRILFPLVFLVAGNSLIAQNFRADSLLQRFSSDQANESLYLEALRAEYNRFSNEALSAHVKKTASFIEENLDVAHRISTFRFLGVVCWARGMYPEALHYFDRAVTDAVAAGAFTEAGIGDLTVAERYMNAEMYTQALERAYKANEHFVTANDTLHQANARALAAAIGYRARNYAVAVEEVEKALTIFHSVRPERLSHADSVDMMNALNTCGLAYAGLGSNEKAMACYAEAEKFAVMLNNRFWIGLINGNKAHIYASNGDIAMAIGALQIDLRHSKEFKQWPSAIGSSLSLSELFIRSERWQMARQYMDTAGMLMSRYSGSRRSKARYLENQSKLFAHAGNIRQAYEALLRHHEIHDSLQVEHQSAELTRIKTAFDIQQKQGQIELLTAEKKLHEQQVVYRNIIAVVAGITIVLLFILALVIYRNYRVKKKDNYLLIEANNEIKAINEELRAYADTLSSQNETIQKMNEDLELRVRSRTRELEEANSELDMFLYRASHDIRRPITTLLGLSNLAHVTTHDLPAMQIFDKVTETAYHMDRMLHKLQMIYALNRPLGTSSQITLTEAIKNAVDKFLPEMKRIGMDCAASIRGNISFTGDESLFSIIFQNLIENSITFKKSDELERPYLSIEAIQLDEHVMVKIRDNGIGIENEYLEKIFDLHFRGTALSRGNGLGLYLVKKALTLLKGRIEVVSEYGVGSNFFVYFPR